PDAAAVGVALAAARQGESPSGVPTLLLVTTPGCDPCERARHDLRFLVRPEDLGAHAHVLSTADATAGTEALGVLVTPAYVLVDEEDRFVAMTRGYRGPVELRAWLREALGVDPP
ncbi:MAG: TlpA family protein disulfide reductase, partial [bacterium]